MTGDAASLQVAIARVEERIIALALGAEARDRRIEKLEQTVEAELEPIRVELARMVDLVGKAQFTWKLVGWVRTSIVAVVVAALWLVDRVHLRWSPPS